MRTPSLPLPRPAGHAVQRAWQQPWLAVAWANLMLCAPLAMAQYKVVGPDGKVTYTDRPQAAAGHQVTAMGLGSNGSNGSGVDTGSLPIALRQVVNRYPVTLYTANGCNSCDAARNLLIQRGIPFAEKRVDSGADVEAYKKLTGGNRDLPMMTVGVQQVRPTTPADWHSYLDAAGYPKESTLPGNYRRPNPTALTGRADETTEAAAANPASAGSASEAGGEGAAAPKNSKIKF